jgi:hypothetical protein
LPLYGGLGYLDDKRYYIRRAQMTSSVELFGSCSYRYNNSNKKV